jgi:hypothetical protein
MPLLLLLALPLHQLLLSLLLGRGAKQVLQGTLRRPVAVLRLLPHGRFGLLLLLLLLQQLLLLPLLLRRGTKEMVEGASRSSPRSKHPGL